MSFVRKNITIKGEQQKFLSDNNLNLSRIVQKTLYYMMEKKTTVLSKNDTEAIVEGGHK